MTEVQAVPADVRVDVPKGAIHDVAAGVGCDHRRFPRRRGQVLARAISVAVVEELAERGYDALTFEGVAARAGTGKSTLYRRWADKPSMIVDCLADALPSPEKHELVGDLREDLLSVMYSYAVGCTGPLGIALRAVCGGASGCVELKRLWKERAVDPAIGLLRQVVQGAIERGEARAGADAYECLIAGPAMIGQLYMANDTAPTREDVTRMVDNVLIPMLEPR
ncbi:TetR/AcrR family transcriptional regulator [Streptodolium elevatio]